LKKSLSSHKKKLKKYKALNKALEKELMEKKLVLKIKEERLEDLCPITDASDAMKRLDAQLSVMGSLAISLNYLGPRYRLAIQPRLNRLISALRTPGFSPSATSSNGASINRATAS